MLKTKYVVITGDYKSDRCDIEGYSKMYMDSIHPIRQLNLILNSLDEESGNVAWIVNNDVTMSHINNLLLLGKTKNNQLSREQGYKGLYIEPKDISIFEFKNDEELSKLEIGEYGYIIPWMSKNLEELFDRTITIQNSMDSS